MKLLKVIVLLTSLISKAIAFVPQPHFVDNNKSLLNVNTFHQKKKTLISRSDKNIPPSIKNQRNSCASIQTMSFFGLGGPEIAVVLIAVFFVVGPQKLAEIGRGAGRAASDFKDVPKEFQKGFEEGEIEARSRNAKQMKEVNPESNDSKTNQE